MLLAIDASTSWASLALLDDAGATVAVRSWDIGQRHSVEIFDALNDLLAAHAIAKEAVSAIAVATGPGSFNGTRVAVTAAKTLAFVWRVPLVGITTLDGIAQTAMLGRMDDGLAPTLLAILEAGRDELYTGWYDLDQSITLPGWSSPVSLVRRRGELALATTSGIGAMPERDLIVCGEISDVHREALGAAFAGRVTFIEARQDRAIGVAVLALARFADGGGDDPMTLEPAYMRRPNITTSERHRVLAPQAENH